MSRMLKSLLFALLLGAPLAAQTNAERMANDQYSRSHDYDLVHQRIEVSDFNWDSLTFQGRVGITLRALRPGFDSVVLDAGALLEIASVTQPAPLSGARSRRATELQQYRFERLRDTLVVHLPRAAEFGDTVRFTVEYHGRVKNGDGLTFIEGDTAEPARPRQLWSQGEDDNNHEWFPTYDFPNDRTTWELIATVPRGFTAVSNGRLVSDRMNPGGTRTMHWAQERPAVTYLVSLVVAPLVKISDRWRRVPVDYYVYRQDSARARRLFGVTPDMIETYSRLTGIDYPWPKYAQSTVADFFGGMENVSATTLVDWLPDARAYADRPWYQHILIPHELAHQWFGDYVTTANWANFWLNEGFAEFMPGQYWEAKQGVHAGEDYYLDEYLQFMGIDRDRRMPLGSLGSNNIYPKGALVLEMLRKYLGKDRFWAGVRRYLRDHSLDVATSDDLRQAFLESTGENLAWFWDQWVYQAGYPEFTVSASWDSTTSVVNLQVAQVQADTLKPDSAGLRYSVPQVFRASVVVRIGTESGDVVGRAMLSERAQTIQVSGVKTAPTMVIFDDGNAILKRLAFDQPTTWLAAQLSHDQNLWNRSWVIDKLAERKNDTEALAALLHAATNADYFLTRVQAVTALGGFTGAGVSAALLEALKDSSAQVRAAAATALAPIPTEEVRIAVRRAWERDTSYTVRAAALGALTRLEPQRARSLLRESLSIPSYQGAIQDAALAGVVQTADTTLLDEVGVALGNNRNAAYVLAAFASRGSARALALLEQRLGDSRATVRDWVLQAFRFGMPPVLARERLTAILAGTPTGRLHYAIEETLERLKP